MKAFDASSGLSCSLEAIRKADIHELLAPDLDAIKETAADMLAFRDRTEALRTSKCRKAASWFETIIKEYSSIT